MVGAFFNVLFASDDLQRNEIIAIGAPVGT